MSIFSKPIDLITADDIKFLVENNIPEGEQIDYKEIFHFEEKDKENGKKEFLKDISSFANKNGGKIIYGIKENKKDHTFEICGLSLNNRSVRSVDAVKRQLVDIVSTGLTPSFNDLGFKEISIDGKDLLILHIPESWNKPHMVMADKKDVGSFWIRNNSQKMNMPYDFLKQSFTSFSLVTQEISRFVANKIEKIKKREIPILLENHAQPQGIIHLIPLSSFKNNAFMPIQNIETQDIIPDKFEANHIHLKNRTNMDGKVFFPEDKGYQSFYIQLYRSGIFETVFQLQHNPKETHLIYGQQLKEKLISTLEKHLSFLQKKLFYPPILIVINFIKVKDYYLGEQDRLNIAHRVAEFHDTKADREDLKFEIMLEKYEDQENIIEQTIIFLYEAFNHTDTK